MSEPATIKVELSKDEWYPVYRLLLPKPGERSLGPVVEIPEADYNRIRAVFDEFNRVQDELAVLYYNDRFVHMDPRAIVKLTSE